MEEQQQFLNIEDNSGDKNHFTIIPNYILNHSTAIDQAVYLQMKRLAGEIEKGGICYPSFNYLIKQLKVGKKALKTSIQYLIEKKWIENIGKRKVQTKGGYQFVQCYKVNDIWKLNMNYYPKKQGECFQTPLEEKGGPEGTKGGPKELKGGLVVAAYKEHIEHIKEEHISKEIEKPAVSPPSYGNEEINNLIGFLKEQLGGSLDGPQQQNRRFAYLLLNKFKKDYPDKNSIELIQFLIQAGLKDDFHGKNITNFKYLYYHAQKIIQSIKGRKLKFIDISKI